MAAFVAFGLLFVSAFVGFGYVLWSFVSDFILGLLAAGLARPLYLRLVVKLKGREALAAAIVVLVVTVSIVLPATFLSVSLTQQATSAYTVVRDAGFSDSFTRMVFGDHWLAENARELASIAGIEYTPANVKQALRDLAGTVLSPLTEQLNAAISNVFAALYHFLIFLVVVYYGLVDGPKLKQKAFDLSPLPDDEEQMFIEKFQDVGRAILLGNGIGSLIQGVLGGFAMWIAGLPSAMFWGAVMTILAFLGLAGIAIVVIPAAGYLLFQGHVGTAISFFAFTMAQGLFVENVVKTKLIGEHVQMHNLLILLSLLGGITAFGLWGIVYGPLVVTLFLSAADLYERAYRDRLLSR